MTDNPYLTLDRQIVGDVYTSAEAMDNLAILCDEFGSRFGGAPGEKQAADFMKAKLEAYGLKNVHLEPIEYTGWRRGETTLEIISPIQKEIPCISLPHSPPCELEGVILDMDEGAPDDFDERADEIAGKIVLTTSEVNPKGVKRWIHRNEKYGRSLLAGATGFIFVNHYPGYGPVTGGIAHKMNGALIPGISVSYEDGAFLQRLIKRRGEVKIRISSNDQTEPMTSWNVIADLPGQEDADQIVMLGCHYDGHDISQGAADPASGAAALLEAARTLAKYAPSLPYTIRFALWGVEEIGLIGSTQHVQKHLSELDNLRFYLNMDMAGAISNKGIVLNQWPQLEPLFHNWSEEMALKFGVKQSISAHSDHYPFLMAGVPTGGIGKVGGKASGGRGYGHTRYDTLDKVTLLGMREAAVLAARLALRIASREAWPVQRRSQEEVAAALDTPENREEEALFARVHAFYEKMA
ncbi:MAG: M20/M25/M40 family metallo-hydrolase [Chloroflexi bacterium]|nr:M20/M25/M40 family metallo-hydrolase [Chloroflexota bacterium]